MTHDTTCEYCGKPIPAGKRHEPRYQGAAFLGCTAHTDSGYIVTKTLEEYRAMELERAALLAEIQRLRAESVKLRAFVDLCTTHAPLWLSIKAEELLAELDAGKETT